MIAVIIGSHGNFAQEILRSCEMICGPRENVAAVTFEPGESADSLVDKYKDILSRLDIKNGILFITDLFGGSPYNAACRIAMENRNAGIVAGINMPMVLEVLSSEMTDVMSAVEIAQMAGRQGIRAFEPEAFKHNEKEEL